MCFKQITSESTFDKIPRRPFLPRCASYRTVSMAMAKSEKSNWRFFPELFRGTDDIIMISLISDFQSWSIINLRLKKHLKKTHLFQRKPSVSVAISMGIPRSQRGNVRWFHGTLAANHGYPEPRKSPSLVLWDVSQNWNTKELVSQRKPLHSSFLQCLGPEPVWRSSGSGGIDIVPALEWLCLKIGNTEKLPLKGTKEKQKRMEWNGFPILREPHRNTSLCWWYDSILLAQGSASFYPFAIRSTLLRIGLLPIFSNSFLACFTKLIFVFEDSPNSSWCQPFDLQLLPNTFSVQWDPADGPLRSRKKSDRCDQWGPFFVTGRSRWKRPVFDG